MLWGDHQAAAEADVYGAVYGGGAGERLYVALVFRKLLHGSLALGWQT